MNVHIIHICMYVHYISLNLNIESTSTLSFRLVFIDFFGSAGRQAGSVLFRKREIFHILFPIQGLIVGYDCGWTGNGILNFDSLHCMSKNEQLHDQLHQVMQ